jgi:ParB family chromosome partitioning protein
VEIIYGARRLFIARHLKKPLAVELRELSDREAIVAMDIENRQRRDISPYERGRSYWRLLRGKHLASQEELARVFNVSAAHVSRALKLARLPSVVVSAFESPADICENWGVELMERWEDEAWQGLMAKRARVIAARSPRPPAAEIYRELITVAARGRRRTPSSHDLVVAGEDGAPLFRIRRQRTSVSLVLPVDRITNRCLEEIRDAAVTILQRTLKCASNAPAGCKSRSAHETTELSG